MRKGLGTLVVPWSAVSVRGFTGQSESGWAGTALGGFGLAPRGPAENCFWSRCSLPSLLFGPEERARTESAHPIQGLVLPLGGWETLGESLYFFLPPVFPRAAVRVGEGTPGTQPPPLGVVHSAQCPAAWGVASADLEPWALPLFSLSARFKRGVRGNQTARRLLPRV